MMRCLFFFLCFTFSATYASELVVFDVGQGNCNLFVPIGGRFPTLYDAGSTKRPDRGEIRPSKAEIVKEITDKISSIMPFHKTLNIVVSHGDTDHYSYIADIIKALGNAYKFHFFLGGKREHYQKSFRDTIEKIPASRRLTYAYAEDGALPPLVVDQYVTSFLSNLATDDKNASSLVLKIARNPLLILLTGDATSSSTDPIDKKEVENTTLMIANHHGSTTHGSNNGAWIDKTTPEVVIFSAAKSTHKHPSRDVVIRVHDSSKIKEESVHEFSYSGDSIGDKRPTLITYHTDGAHHRSLIRKSLFNTTNEGTMLLKLEKPGISIRPDKPFFSMFPFKGLIEINLSNMEMVNRELEIIGPKMLVVSLLKEFYLYTNHLEIDTSKERGTEVISIVKKLLEGLTSLEALELWDQRIPVNGGHLRDAIGDDGLFGKIKLTTR